MAPVANLPGLAVALREAARTVARVAAGHSLSTELERRAEESEEAGGRAALLDLCYGTLRRYGRVQAVLAALSQRGRPDPAVEALIWCALYALESGRYAPYTVVDQAVRACAALGYAAAKGYVNGVLRAWLRRRAPLEAKIAARPEARYQHPGWWIDKLRLRYPHGWEQILEAGNTHPPMCLRVNARRLAPQHYALKLQAAGLVARPAGPVALLLDKPVPVERLPGFAHGEVSVQDAGAQRAVPYLDLQPGQRVLDACAAPGGKAGHILETADVMLTALDSDAARCARITQNFARLGLSATVKSADCTRPERWWGGEPFERILADVPCSGSGVVRRHPDIKWLRRSGDLDSFAQRQGAILEALWRTLAPNGKLLYVTCSVFPEENDAVVDAFGARTPDARRLALLGGAPGQLLPGPEHDGFFFALLEKRPRRHARCEASPS